MLPVQMQTHLRPTAAVLLVAALAFPAGAEERWSLADETLQLRGRIEVLEGRVAELEAVAEKRHAGGKAIERVALIADRAMANLVEMVRGWTGGASADE